ncbi:MAG: nitroreductase [Erysipelotrichaceae bacterium]|nr:nitroreductase [Erysipelotrichaceae bacterium]
MRYSETMYEMIFKRKSFHLFKDLKTKELYKEKYQITPEELEEIQTVFSTFKPLIEDIKVEIRIVENELTTCSRGQEYCILVYSEKKSNYLQNIGFLCEQLDLYLASQDIGALWFGIGKTEESIYHGLDFVTMIAIGKVPSNKFRVDMFKAKRKLLEEIWQGDQYLDIANIVRFAPSSCNTQPWFVKEEENRLLVYRYQKPGKRGIMPIEKVTYQNLLDIGIFILFLCVCLEHSGIKYSLEVKDDHDQNKEEMTLSCIIQFME